jgi:hypothetical protein
MWKFLISTFKQAQQKYLYSLAFIPLMLHVSVAGPPSSGKNTVNMKEESGFASWWWPGDWNM